MNAVTFQPTADEPRAQGKIIFHRTHIGAWEEDVDKAAIRGRFRSLLARLRDHRGFRIRQDQRVSKLIRPGYYEGRKGDLEFYAQQSGRMFEIDFFQNINVVNRNGGRYDFDKFELMPRPVQLACVVEMSHVLRKLIEMGYVLDDPRHGITRTDLLAVRRHAEGRTDEGDPLAQFNRRWNFEGDWKRGGRFERDESGWPSAKETDSWASKDRDGRRLVSGEAMHCRRNGRLFRGVVRPNMNDMWIVISHGRCEYVHASEIFQCDPSTEPRRFVPGQAARLRQELEKALKAKEYRRVEAIARVLARGEAP